MTHKERSDQLAKESDRLIKDMGNVKSVLKTWLFILAMVIVAGLLVFGVNALR